MPLLLVGSAEQRRRYLTPVARDGVLFDDCRISADRLVGPPGSGLRTALRALGHSRVAIAAQAVGIGQGALDHARRYVTQRVQFGRPVADFQGVRFMLAGLGHGDGRHHRCSATARW